MQNADTFINDTAKAKVNDLIGYLADSVKSGGDIIAREAPEVAREIVAWRATYYKIELVQSVFWLVVAVAMIVAGVLIIRRVRREWDNMSFEDSMLCLFPTGIGLVVAVALLGCNANGASREVQQLVKCKTAPRLVVLDYLRETVK